MKNVRLLILFALIVVAFSSCEKEEEEPVLYSTIGMICISSDSVIVENDAGKRMLIAEPNLRDEIKDSTRVILFFYFTDIAAPVGVDFVVEQYFIEKVLVKPVIIFTEEIADSLGDDKISINSMEVSRDYLNFNFDFSGGYVVHNINITRNEGDIPADTIDLVIRHNGNEDPGNSWINAFVSFDLSSLKNNLADSVIIHIKANDYDYTNYHKYLTYKFKNALD
jgi:hypothetical protein